MLRGLLRDCSVTAAESGLAQHSMGCSLRRAEQDTHPGAAWARGEWKHPQPAQSRSGGTAQAVCSPKKGKTEPKCTQHGARMLIQVILLCLAQLPQAAETKTPLILPSHKKLQQRRALRGADIQLCKQQTLPGQAALSSHPPQTPLPTSSPPSPLSAGGGKGKALIHSTYLERSDQFLLLKDIPASREFQRAPRT